MYKNLIEKFMVLVYNIILLAGASYLVYYKDASPWLYLLVVILAGSWSSKKEKSINE